VTVESDALPGQSPFDRPPLDYPAGRDLADDYTLTNSARAVYGHLATRCTFTRFETVKAWSIEKRLRMHEETISLALRQLVSHGYIECVPSGVSRARAYRLVWDRNKSHDKDRDSSAA